MTSYAQARHWAKTIIEDSEVAPYRKATLAAARYILDHPPATMKDVDWDDKHHLMEAEITDGDTVVMLAPSQSDRSIVVSEGGEYWNCDRDNLTPTGRYWSLTPPQDEDNGGEEHPDTLTTARDYEDAPEGTIVAQPENDPWKKKRYGVWESLRDVADDCDMRGTTRRVLRWGWGK